MIRSLRENLALKLIALSTAVMIWSYAATERASSPTRQVLAEVVAVGQPPQGLNVDLVTASVPVEVAGPRAQLDAIAEGSVKAIVDLGSAKAGAKALRVSRFVAPPEAPGVTFPPQSRAVEATIRSTARKRMKISGELTNEPPLGKRYADPVIEPGWADVEGPREAVERVSMLLVRPDMRGTDYRGQVIIDPVDRNRLSVNGVAVHPPNAHVQVEVRDLAEARTLMVSPMLRGRPAPPFMIASVECDPTAVTVFGSARSLLELQGVATVPIHVEGIRADTTRQVALDLPAGIETRGGRVTVDVTIRVKDASRVEPQ